MLIYNEFLIGNLFYYKYKNAFIKLIMKAFFIRLEN